MSLEHDKTETGAKLSEVQEVRGSFHSAKQMQEAVRMLSVSGFDRADLSVPELSPPIERSTPESGAKPAYTEADARQTRTLQASTAAAGAALLGAGTIVATGGGAMPAAAAAIAVGAAAGGATYAVSKSTNDAEQKDRDARATAGRLIVAVRVPTEAKRSEAEAILRSAGAEIPTHVG